jgi:hypothetical protein
MAPSCDGGSLPRKALLRTPPDIALKAVVNTAVVDTAVAKTAVVKNTPLGITEKAFAQR